MCISNVQKVRFMSYLVGYLQGENEGRCAATRGVPIELMPDLSAAMLTQYRNREIPGYMLIQHYRGDELDENNPQDVERAADIAFDLAKRVFGEGAAFSVVVHVDSDGGGVDVHTVCLNHDFQTGKSMQNGHYGVHVQRINDQLMTENGFEIVKPIDRTSTWEKRRAEIVAHQGAKTPLLVRTGDILAEARENAVDLESYKANCAALGVTIQEWERGGRSGFTYKVPNEKGKYNRVKDSNLCHDFQPDQLEKYFDYGQLMTSHEKALEVDQEEEEFPQLKSVFGNDNYNDESTTQLQEFNYAVPDVQNITKNYKNGDDFELSL